MTMPLIPDLSRTFRALCALALLGAAACSGTIEGDDLDDSPSARSDSPEDQSDGTRESTTRDRAQAEDDADERALGEDDQDEDDVRGISGRPRASGSSGGRRSARDRDDEELTDAGLDDAGVDDAGVVVDAGVIVDAGVVEVDAGANVDAGAP